MDCHLDQNFTISRSDPTWRAARFRSARRQYLEHQFAETSRRSHWTNITAANFAENGFGGVTASHISKITPTHYGAHTKVILIKVSIDWDLHSMPLASSKQEMRCSILDA